MRLLTFTAPNLFFKRSARSHLNGLSTSWWSHLASPNELQLLYFGYFIPTVTHPLVCGHPHSNVRLVVACDIHVEKYLQGTGFAFHSLIKYTVVLSIKNKVQLIPCSFKFLFIFWASASRLWSLSLLPILSAWASHYIILSSNCLPFIPITADAKIRDLGLRNRSILLPITISEKRWFSFSARSAPSDHQAILDFWWRKFLYLGF